jgi:hypothetical protein
MNNKGTLPSAFSLYRHQWGCKAVSILWVAIVIVSGAEQSMATGKTQPAVQATPPPTPKVSREKQRSIWTALLSLLKRAELPLSSRSQQTRNCPILPGLVGPKNVIWNNRPLFVWQGQIKSLEVRPYSLSLPYETQPLLWRQDVMRERFARYTGTALQAGQTYEWQIVGTHGNVQRYTFKVMEQNDSDTIRRELSRLENRLKTAQVSPEELMQSRTQVFIERQLWSDALQEMYRYSEQLLPLEHTAITQEFSDYLCA